MWSLHFNAVTACMSEKGVAVQDPPTVPYIVHSADMSGSPPVSIVTELVMRSLSCCTVA